LVLWARRPLSPRSRTQRHSGRAAIWRPGSGSYRGSVPPAANRSSVRSRNRAIAICDAFCGRSSCSVEARATEAGEVSLAHAASPTPLTSTTTTCMMSCNGQFANCQSSGIATRSLPRGTIAGNPSIAVGDVSAAGCISFCTNQQLSCLFAQISSFRARPPARAHRRCNDDFAFSRSLARQPASRGRRR
jgi:hypothetical protein